MTNGGGGKRADEPSLSVLHRSGSSSVDIVQFFRQLVTNSIAILLHNCLQGKVGANRENGSIPYPAFRARARVWG